MKIALVIAASIFIIIALSFLSSKNRSKQIEAVFQDRKPLSKESFYENHFLSAGIKPEVVHGVRDVLEYHLDADMSRLSAEDDFSTNLKFFFSQDSMIDADIVVSLEEKFCITIANDEAANAKTVRDIINLVSGKLAGS